ncbi:hypothetical protein [uncultured Cohaesibacter sp.]|uniref:hypothetical protein n=1 Tax=uncultured Cohaesibacter sp. TaxID=1002546 RepID=UPI0029C6CBED|nr:hypothetical protein [uncultured Cohaesibacter sp.]
MGESDLLPEEFRTSDYFNHIDMGFLNERLAITALGPLRNDYFEKRDSSTDHIALLQNRHLLVTMLIDLYRSLDVPTLLEALELNQPRHVFMSIEQLEPCLEIYDKKRVSHNVIFDIHREKHVKVSYHTSHICADTGRMILAEGKGYRQAIIGLLYRRDEYFEIEPIVIGSPWLDHPRNKNGHTAIWLGQEKFGEILAEDIEEFKEMKQIKVSSAEEWMDVMAKTPESFVKSAVCKLLSEPEKADWGGEDNDHYSSNVTLAGRRHTAAFLLKGPSKFQEMTPAMCGKNGDQIYRLDRVKADISVIQHSHLIGVAVRETLRKFVVQPGQTRKFCIIDGQATYRLLKAYKFV